MVTISTFMCLFAIYIFSGSVGPHSSCSRIDRTIMGIYKSLTDTCMWKLRQWPRNSFSGNNCFQFSVLVICSVAAYHIVLDKLPPESAVIPSGRMQSPHAPLSRCCLIKMK